MLILKPSDELLKQLYKNKLSGRNYIKTDTFALNNITLEVRDNANISLYLYDTESCTKEEVSSNDIFEHDIKGNNLGDIFISNNFYKSDTMIIGLDACNNKKSVLSDANRKFELSKFNLIDSIKAKRIRGVSNYYIMANELYYGVNRIISFDNGFMSGARILNVSKDGTSMIWFNSQTMLYYIAVCDKIIKRSHFSTCQDTEEFKHILDYLRG